jgi:hypothetical protein
MGMECGNTVEGVGIIEDRVSPSAGKNREFGEASRESASHRGAYSKYTRFIEGHSEIIRAEIGLLANFIVEE